MIGFGSHVFPVMSGALLPLSRQACVCERSSR